LETDWQTGALGRAIIAAESQLLAQAFDDVFGLETVQLGRWGQGRELLARCRTRRQTLIAESNYAEVDIVAQLTQLPVATASVDALLLPHSLEFETDPHAVLREADRVLLGEGQLLVLGFRPRSPWGWRAAASRHSFPPGLRRLLSEGRVRDWLVLLGYEIISVRRYLYAWPVTPRGEAPSLAGALQRGWFYPWPASAYILKARKRLFGVTPLRPRRRERRALLGEALEPTV
jgi:SAM-dependent methyltransferase